LYDSLPLQTCDKNFDKVEEASSTISHPHSEGASLTSPPASIISDSVAYCGKFPVQDHRSCRQCGEPIDQCQHRAEGRDEVSSVSSCGQSSAPSVAVSDQPITFNTFHPFKSNHDKDSAKETSLGTGLNDIETEKSSKAPVTRLQGSNLNNGGKKRLSAIELPSGETYLPIEQRELAVINPAALEKDLGLVAREYRGGGTLPRHGLQQEWLEASLNYSEPPSKSLARTKDRGSRKSIFRNSKRSSSDRGNSLPRRKSSAKEVKVLKDEHSSDVAFKGKDMF